jgi:hypothetical protein
VSVIPRILHQLWVGSDPPEWVLVAWREWDARFVPEGWDIRRCRELPEPVEKLRSTYGISYRSTSDLFRMFMLRVYGGVYVDSDSVPIRSLLPYVGEHRPWIGRPIEEHSEVVLCASLMGFPPGHSFLDAVWELAVDNLRKGIRNDHFVGGPRAVSKVYRRCPGVIDLPAIASYDNSRHTFEALHDRHPFDYDWLRQRHPTSAVVHLSPGAERGDHS